MSLAVAPKFHYTNPKILKHAKGQVCTQCGKEFKARGRQLTSGAPLYCSASCRSEAKRIIRQCRNCNKSYSVLNCRVKRDHFCSPACGDEYRASKSLLLRASRLRNCKKCGYEFVAKKSQIDDGHGQYCSHQCASDDGVRDSAHTPSANSKRIASWLAGLKSGKFTLPIGASNPRWKGGPEASRARNKHKMSARTRAYRLKNPEKAREWAGSRARRMLGKLPVGTVSKIRRLQRNRCAVCKCNLKRGYHVDHIKPLAKGGPHVAANIQLLCPTCNVRKSAKDPIDFMQERGFLL